MAERGVFDLAAPVFDAVDAALAAVHVAVPLRIALYAAVSAWLCMFLYRRCSAQETLARIRDELKTVRERLLAHDGDFAGLWPLLRGNLALSLRQLWLTAGPSLLASLPLLFVMPWLSNRFGEPDLAPGRAVEACVQPSERAASLRWEPAASATETRAGCWTLVWPAASAPMRLGGDGRVWAQLPFPAPGTIVHRKSWINALFGNPAGYLDAQAPFDALILDVAPDDWLPFGPAWLGHWMTLFMAVMLPLSLLLRHRWRLR